VDPDGKEVRVPTLQLSPQALQRNGEIRATVMGFLNKWDPFLGDAVAADIVMGLVLPASQKEYDINLMMSAFGMVAPLELPGAISMEEAVALGAKHVGGEGVMELTGSETNFQFRAAARTATGQTEQRISRFDVNPADGHVASEGPHLNRQVQVGKKTVSNVHTPIDPKTVRSGDHP
jgi:hypothetical protein